MNRTQQLLAFALASALVALPALVFNGWGWYPSIDFFKWALTFPLAAYGAGYAAYALAAGRAEITGIELAWLALALLSLAQPLVTPIRGSVEWLRNVYFFAALGGATFALRNLPIDEALPWILRAYSVTGGISTLFGFIQRVAPRSGLPFILDASLAPDRFLANTGLDNELGAYLALAVIAGVWLLLHDGGHKLARAARSLDVALIAVNCVGLWKTGARSAFIAAIAGALTLLLASRFRTGLWKKFLASLAVTAAAAAAIAICVSLAAPGSLRVERRDMSRLFSPESLAGEGRLVIWGVTLEMIKGAPLLGRGLGNYKWNYLDAMASYRERSSTPPRYTRWAHNEYLQWIAETGIVGGALFFSLLAFCVKICARGAREKKSPQLAWSLAAIATLAADACFSRPMHHVDTAFTLSLAIAMISRLASRPAKLGPTIRRAVAAAIALFAGSGLALFTQSLQGQDYLGKYYYNPSYITTTSSEARERHKPPLLLRDAYLNLIARENYTRALFNLGDRKGNDRDAIRLLEACFATQPAYEELNRLMLILQRRGDFDEGRRYFKYYPPDEREKFLRGEFDGKYMLD